MRRLACPLLAVLLSFATMGCGLFGSYCPTGLGEGILAKDGQHNAILMTGDRPTRVRWPNGYSVDPGLPLPLFGGGGNLVASEGETVYVGGGMDSNNEVIIACGRVSRDPP